MHVATKKAPLRRGFLCNYLGRPNGAFASGAIWALRRLRSRALWLTSRMKARRRNRVPWTGSALTHAPSRVRWLASWWGPAGLGASGEWCPPGTCTMRVRTGVGRRAHTRTLLSRTIAWRCAPQQQTQTCPSPTPWAHSAKKPRRNSDNKYRRDRVVADQVRIFPLIGQHHSHSRLSRWNKLFTAGEAVMRHELLRKYVTNPRDFDRWLKANVLVGSLVTVAILTMALAALYSGGGSNQIELSSVSRVSSGSRWRSHARVKARWVHSAERLSDARCSERRAEPRAPARKPGGAGRSSALHRFVTIISYG